MRVLPAVVFAPMAVLAACNGTGNTGPAASNTTGSSTGSTTSGSGSNYAFTEVTDCGETAGIQTVMVAKGSGVAFATIRDSDTKTTCTLEGRPPEDLPNSSICYGEASGSTVTASEAKAVPMKSFVGLGLAVAPNGTTSLAYLGGANAPLRCGGTDLEVISKTSGAFGAETALATDSPSTGFYCPPASPAPAPPTYLTDMTTCGSSPDCAQNVCGSGEVTGFWPALAYDSNNNLITAFRDVHHGNFSDDFAKSDVELKKGSAGFVTIDVSVGGGWYTQVGVTSDNRVTVVHFNKEGTAANRGIWAHRETAVGITRQKIADVSIGETMSMAISANGTHGVVFHDAQNKHLGYLESQDGIVWNEVEYVDNAGNTGQNPSITFDANNDPIIAYYRCSNTTSDSNCDQSKDGLLVARRVQGAWQKTIVSQDNTAFDGTYPAVALVGGKIWIAFQKKTFDPSINPPAGKTYRKLFLAKEP